MPVDIAYRFTVTKGSLRDVPAPARKFLLAASHCLNEICILQKLLAIQAGSLVEDEPEQTLQAHQGMFLLRLLAGKLVEAWNTMSHYFGPIACKFEPGLERETIAALSRLRRYFAERANSLRAARDGFVFHYSTDLIDAEFEALPDDATFQTVVGSMSGNTFMGFADEVAGRALLKQVPTDSLQEALDSLFDEVTRVSADLVMFASDSIGLIVNTSAPEAFRMTEENRIDLSARPTLDEVRLPFLLRKPTTGDVSVT